MTRSSAAFYSYLHVVDALASFAVLELNKTGEVAFVFAFSWNKTRNGEAIYAALCSYTNFMRNIQAASLAISDGHALGRWFRRSAYYACAITRS